MRNLHMAWSSAGLNSRSLTLNRGRATVPALVALVMAGACSGGSESADTTEGAVTSEAGSVPATDIAGRPLATTTTPPPAPTPTPTTTAEIGVAISTSVATPAPTGQTPEGAVQSAVGRAERTFLEVMRDPAVALDDGLAAIQAVTAQGSSARSSFESTYSARRGSSLALVENEQVPFTVTTDGDVFMIAANEAWVQVCVIDSDVIVRIELNADGEEEQSVVGDEVVTARRSTQRFVLSPEGQWQLATNEVIAEYPGETACPAE